MFFFVIERKSENKNEYGEYDNGWDSEQFFPYFYPINDGKMA